MSAATLILSNALTMAMACIHIFIIFLASIVLNWLIMNTLAASIKLVLLIVSCFMSWLRVLLSIVLNILDYLIATVFSWSKRFQLRLTLLIWSVFEGTFTQLLGIILTHQILLKNISIAGILW